MLFGGKMALEQRRYDPAIYFLLPSRYWVAGVIIVDHFTKIWTNTSVNSDPNKYVFKSR